MLLNADSWLLNPALPHLPSTTYHIPSLVSRQKRRIVVDKLECPRVAHTLVCMYAPIDPAYAGLRPGYRSGFLAGPGGADMKGPPRRIGATRGCFTFLTIPRTPPRLLRRR